MPAVIKLVKQMTKAARISGHIEDAINILLTSKSEAIIDIRENKIHGVL